VLAIDRLRPHTRSAPADPNADPTDVHRVRGRVGGASGGIERVRVEGLASQERASSQPERIGDLFGLLGGRLGRRLCRGLGPRLAAFPELGCGNGRERIECVDWNASDHSNPQHIAAQDGGIGERADGEIVKGLGVV